VHVFAVEMASTPEEQAKGLCFAANCRKGRACCSTSTRNNRPASG
jgi:uncharacterized membrane protein (UPF0127 family)